MAKKKTQNRLSPFAIMAKKKIQNRYSPFARGLNEKDFDCIDFDLKGERCKEQCAFCSIQ